MRLRPLHRGSERSPLDRHHAPRVDPLHRAGARCALRKVSMEEPRRPDFTETRDQIAHLTGSGAGERHAAQDAVKILAVAVKACEVVARRGGGEQRPGHLRMPLAQQRDLGAEGYFLLLGQADEPEQRIRHAAAGGQHHCQAPRRLRFEKRGDAGEAIGVRDARSSELVDDPTIRTGHRIEVSRRKGAATVLTRGCARNPATPAQSAAFTFSSASPSRTRRPALTRSSATTPAAAAISVCSIFIASMTTSA
jgi:hypothetical protein